MSSDPLQERLTNALFPASVCYHLNQDGFSGTMNWAIRSPSLPSSILEDQKLMATMAGSTEFKQQNLALIAVVENRAIATPVELHMDTDDQLWCEVTTNPWHSSRLTVAQDLIYYLEELLDIPTWYHYSYRSGDTDGTHFLVHLGEHGHLHAYVKVTEV